MLPSKTKAGFTLVELLVVIAIIGTLMGLLLPAVQSARESGRRNTCTNNVNQLAKAVINYDAQKGSVPGWRHPLVTTASVTRFVSWPIPLLPQLERLDIYRQWEAGASPSPYLGLFVCPTAPTADQASPWLSYAANAGTGGQRKADGVFLDTAGTTGGGAYAGARTNLDVISSKDGATNTLLFAEKCGSQMSAQNTWASAGDIPAVALTGTSLFVQASVPSVFGIGNPLTATIAGSRILNGVTTPTVTDLSYVAQPNANHPGGVVAAFADGHTVFVKDSIRPNVYAQILTSDYINGSAVLMASGTGWLMNPVTTGTVPYILQDGDY